MKTASDGDAWLSRMPARSPTFVMIRASLADARPAGIGFDGFEAASRSRSLRSLKAPIDTWSASIASPSRRASPTVPPARSARAVVARPLSAEGNGWPSWTRPRMRSSAVTGSPARGWTGPSPGTGASDVDELVEVLDEVVDEPAASVGDARSDARDEREQADRRHDQL